MINKVVVNENKNIMELLSEDIINKFKILKNHRDVYNN